MTLRIYLWLIARPLRSRRLEYLFQQRLHRRTQRWRESQFKQVVPWKQWVGRNK